MESSRDKGMMLMDLFFQLALGNRNVYLYLDCKSWAVLAEEGCPFLTLLGKGVCVSPFVPHLPSVPHLKVQQVTAWAEDAASAHPYFPSSKNLTGCELPFVLCRQRSSLHRATLAVTPVSQSCCWSLLLASELSECWFLPGECSWPTAGCQCQPEAPGFTWSAWGTMELLSWIKKTSKSSPVLSVCTKKEHTAREECAELAAGSYSNKYLCPLKGQHQLPAIP